MPRSKRVRKSVNYAESDLSSLTEPSSQVYDTSRRRSRRSRRARDQLPFSPASPSVVEIAPERATSRSSIPPLEPIPFLPAPDEFCFALSD
jgi:hypothetical protein